MTPSTKRLLHWAGSALAAVALVFVCKRLWVYASQIDLSAFPLALWGVIGGLSIVYGLANLCLPRLWLACLHRQGVDLPLWRAVAIYGYSQIGKYIPGNVAHLAGRQALAMLENLPGKAVAASMVWENILLLCVTCGTFLLPALVPLFWRTCPLSLVLVLFVCMCAALLCLGRYLLNKHIYNGMFWTLVFFICMAFTWGVTLAGITGLSSAPDWLLVSSIWYVIAWLVGFVTPGAPAGLGMREAAILLLAKNGPFPEEALLLACLLCRCISVLGDVLFFGASLTMQKIKTI